MTKVALETAGQLRSGPICDELPPDVKIAKMAQDSEAIYSHIERLFTFRYISSNCYYDVSLFVIQTFYTSIKHYIINLSNT